MPIRTEDVKIKESQRLTDHNDGGGYMTAREVVRQHQQPVYGHFPARPGLRPGVTPQVLHAHGQDRKSTRLNSSHGSSSYAVFC